MNEPAPPREAVLIRQCREARRPKLSMNAAAKQMKFSGSRWRQIENGYQTIAAGVRSPVVAPAETLAHMAEVVGATPEQLEEAGRGDAAAILRAARTRLPQGMADFISPSTAGDGQDPAGVERPYLHLFTLLWTSSRSLAEAVLNVDQPVEVLQEVRQLLAVTVDVASDLLVVSPDAAVSKPLLQQMFEEFYGLRSVINQRVEDLNHDVEAEAEPDASGKTNQNEEAVALSGDAEREDVALTVDEVAPAVEDVGVDSQDGQAFGQ